MKLRDYQEAAADGIFREWEEHTSALAVLPTGLGKTVLFAEIIRRMHERGARAMVLAHREELITQAADKIRRVTGLEAQIEMGEYHVQPYFGQMPPVSALCRRTAREATARAACRSSTRRTSGSS